MTARIVGLAGDWHGNTDWAQGALRSLAEAGVTRVYHLGDFGIWPGESGQRYLDRLEATARRFGLEVWVTPGNHEDYDQIVACGDWRDGLAWIRPHIGLIPRGHRWSDEGRMFVSLGGAPSIDREARTVGVSWWPGEMITYAEADAVHREGTADVMLAHDAPDGSTAAVRAIIGTPPDQSPWSAAGLAYAREGRLLMNHAVAGVKPRLFAHGHYHAPDDSGPTAEGTRYLSLGCDGQPMNLCLLRLDDLAVSWDGKWPAPVSPVAGVGDGEGGGL